MAILFRPCLLLVFLIVFLLQSVDFFNDYYSFRTLQSIAFLRLSKVAVPAFTFCDENLARFQYITFATCKSECDNNLQCSINYPIHPENITYARKGELFCGTFFSAFLEKEFKVSEITVETATSLNMECNLVSNPSWLSIHSPTTPPRKTNLLQTSLYNIIHTKVVHHLLMPAPFDTDCTNYTNTSFLSQSDCLLRCQPENRNLSTFYFKSGERFVNPETVLALKNFTTKNELKMCYKQCKKECYFQQFLSTMGLKSEGDSYMFGIKVGQFFFVRKPAELFISYSQGMTFIYTMVQIGGLLGLWFGISIKDVLSKLFKANKCILFHCYCIVFLVCFYQSFLVAKSYYDFKTFTSPTFHKSYEKFGVMPSIGFLVYGAYSHELTSVFNTSLINWSKNKTTTIKLLYTSSPPGHLFTFVFDKKSIKKNKYSINLRNFENSETIIPLPFSVYLVKINDYNSIEKITSLKSNTLYDVRIKQTTFQRLESPFDTNSFKYEEGNNPNTQFDEQRQCIFDCVLKKFSETFNCSFNNDVMYDLESGGVSELNLGQKPCKDAFKKPSFATIKKKFGKKTKDELKEKSGEFKKICSQNCGVACTERHYSINSYNKQLNPDIGQNLSFVEISFDNNDFIIEYVAKPKMIAFVVFYEIGGLISLWFGFSFFYLFSFQCCQNSL